jgi:cobalt-zinc-cadmium efflux system outer membrane protein
MLSRCARRSGLVVTIALAACSNLPYSPRPLDPAATAPEYAQRSGNADGLKNFAVANGYSGSAWPPAEWGLRELTLAALYFHADIRTARARAQVARAELVSATQSQALSARVKPEYHSQELPEDSGPWSLGLELEIPLVAQGKRAARVERSSFLADAADADIAVAGWQVRARVRDRLFDLQGSRANLELVEAQLAARREMLALVARRVEAGLLSARDLGAERIAVAQLEGARDEGVSRHQRALGELASALGLPLDVLRGMKLSFPNVEIGKFAFSDSELRGLALRNRLDVHRKLLEFGAADAEVKLAVAAQNPDIVLGPGYTWDQGDNVWSLAVGLSVPSAARASAAIREAEARRELAAQLFIAVQTGAIADTERVAVQVRLARDRMAAALQQARIQQEQEARVARQFDAGAADRLQRVAAQLETLATRAAVHAAQVEVRQSLAQLEDAVQKPFFGDFESLPDARAAPLPEVSRQ